MQELDRLHRADPVNLSELPDGDSLRAQILLDRLTTEPAMPAGPRAVPRLAIAGLAGAAVLLGGAFAALSAGSGPDLPAAVAPADQPPVAVSGLGMCAETYSLETLVVRDVAFDGTLLSVDGDQMTFRVTEAFRGVDGDTITLAGAAVVVGDSSLVGGSGLAIGDRALVAGTDGFAWGCGFTQAYGETAAAAWRQAFAG